MSIPRRPFQLRRTATLAGAVLCGAFLCSAIPAAWADNPYAQTIDSHLTEFDPALDMLPVQNEADPTSMDKFESQRSSAADGRCLGINETNVSYFNKRRNDPSMPRLAAFGEEIKKNHPGTLEKAAVNAQLYASSRGILRYGENSLRGVSPAAQIAKDMRETKSPQILSIATAEGVRHSISAYGFTVKQSQGRNIYIFNIADPNFGPGTPENKLKTLEYDEGTKSWSTYQSGLFSYNQVKLRRDPRPIILWDRMVSLATGKPLKSSADREPIQDPTYYLNNLKAAARGQVLPAPKATEATDGAAGVTVTKEEVGGVLVQFDPSAFSHSSEQEVRQVNLQIQKFLDSDQAGTLVIKSASGQEAFETLSLRQWLASGQTTLGNLTRVRGYVLQDNDVLLIGTRDPSMSAIDGDVLTVALNTIYREGSTPFISLDPNPSNFYGPQQVRVGGISRFEQSEFVRIMLDADYDMKRISLGELAVDVPGFESWYEILRKSENAEPGASRSWLTPVSSSVGDIFESGPGVIFQSRVQVLTERMKELSDYSVWPRESRPEDERAAELMTTHFSDLERKVPTFYRLHGLFDVAKLSAILRFRQVTSDTLEAVANRPVKIVPHKREYAGIGPKVIDGTTYVIGGGAVAKVRVAKSAFRQSPAVGNFLNGQKTISLERSAQLSPDVNPDLMAHAAARDYARGDLRDCIAHATSAIAIDDDLYEAYLYRALARASLGNSEEAVADLDYVVDDLPQMQGLRGVIKLYAGDIDGANRDVDEVVGKFSELEESWLFNAQVKVYSLDFVAAQSALNHLFQLNGMSLEGHSLKATATMLARMEPTEAGAYVKRNLQLPLPLGEALWRAYAATHSFDSQSAKKAYEHALELARNSSDDPKVKQSFAVERILFLLTTVTAKEDPAQSGSKPGTDAAPRRAKATLDKASFELRMLGELVDQGEATMDEYKEQEAVVERAQRELQTALLQSRPAMKYAQIIIDDHPDWASGYLARALALLGAGTEHAEEASQLMSDAFARDTSKDPLIHDLELYYGHSVRDTFYALGYMLTANAPGNRVEQRLAFLRSMGNGQNAVSALATTVTDLENAFEKRRVNSDSSRVALNATVRERAHQAISQAPGKNIPEMILYSRMLTLYAGWEMNEDQAEAVRASRAVQLNLPPDDATPEAVSIIGLLRVQGVDQLAESYLARIKGDAKLKKFIEDQGGDLNFADIKTRSQALAQQAIQESRKLDPPVVNRLLMEIYFPDIANEAEDAILSSARARVIEQTAIEGPASPEDNSIGAPTDPTPTPTPPVAAIDSARAAIEERRATIAARHTPKELAKSSDAIIGSAVTPADLKFLEIYFLRLTTVAQVMAGSQGELEKAALFKSFHESLSAKLRLRGMKLLRTAELPKVNHRSLVWPSPPIWRKVPSYAVVIFVVLLGIALFAFTRFRRRALAVR